MLVPGIGVHAEHGLAIGGVHQAEELASGEADVGIAADVVGALVAGLIGGLGLPGVFNHNLNNGLLAAHGVDDDRDAFECR